MKKLILSTTCALALSACGHDPRELNQDNVTKAMNAYLASRGDLCLAKSSWPIDVAPEESGARSRNGLQMPVLERLGLVAGSDAVVDKLAQDGARSAQAVRRYRLTDAGSKFFLARAPHKHPTDNRYAAVSRDFCAARLSLDKVVGWERTNAAGVALVTYTYKVSAAPWTGDAGVREAFPMVDAVIRGAGQLQMKETLLLGVDGWEARDL